MNIRELIIEYGKLIDLARSQGVLNDPGLCIESMQRALYNVLLLPGFTANREARTIPFDENEIDKWLDLYLGWEDRLPIIGYPYDILRDAGRAVAKLDKFKARINWLIDNKNAPNYEL